MFHSFIKSFEDQASLSPQGVALSLNGEHVSYEEMNQRANRLARYLVSQQEAQCPELRRGVSTSLNGARVALMMPKCLDYYIAVLAIWKAGGSVVFIKQPEYDEQNNEWASDKIAQTLIGQPKSDNTDDWGVLHDLTKTQSHLVLRHPRYAELFNQKAFGELKCVPFAPQLMGQFDGQNLEGTINPSDEAYIVFTSGTTGAPKGAINTHEGLPSRVDSIASLMQINQDSVVAQDRPLHIDASLQEMIVTLAKGARLEIMPEGIVSWQDYIQHFNRYRISHATLVPSILEAIRRESNKNPFETLKFVLPTGEAMAVETYQFYAAGGITLVNGYGPSECTIGATLGVYKNAAQGEKKISIGQPMQGVQIRVLKTESEFSAELALDAAGRIQDADEDEAGHLVIMGVGVGRGYTNNRKLTQERFQLLTADGQLKPVPKDWQCQPGEQICYLSGDKASKDAQGYLFLAGRFDRQFKIRSKLIMPEQIETWIKAMPGVACAQVDALVNKKGERERLIAGVQFKTAHHPSFRDIMAALEKHLEKDLIPAYWREFKANESRPSAKWKDAQLFEPGILLDSEMASQFIPAVSHGSSSIEQGGDVFNEVKRLTQNLLGAFEIAEGSTFTQLGGDSLNAIRLGSQIQQTYNVNFTSREILNSSVKGLADAIDAETKLVEVVYLNENVMIGHDASARCPVVFVHALLGDAFENYVRFSQEFKDRAMLGISVKSMRQHGSIQAYAKNYANAIQQAYTRITKRAEHTQYMLVGWSSGGVIAHNIARILREKGHNVGLFMIDSISGHGIQSMPASDHRAFQLQLIRHTGQFIAGLSGACGKAYAQKLKMITLTNVSENVYTKEEDVNHVFRQLLAIHENFRSAMPVEVYKKHLQTIMNAWSIAVGVINYQPTDCLNIEPKKASGLNDAEPGFYCKLFYATKDKEREMGAKIDRTLGWQIDRDRQIHDLSGNHMGVVKEGTPACEEMLRVLKERLRAYDGTVKAQSSHGDDRPTKRHEKTGEDGAQTSSSTRQPIRNHPTRCRRGGQRSGRSQDNGKGNQTAEKGSIIINSNNNNITMNNNFS